MKNRELRLFTAILLSSSAMAVAQTPTPKQAPAPRLVLWVTSTAWQDGAEIPMKNAARGENKSPAFEFHWNRGNSPATAPDTLKSYAVIFHDVENSNNKTTADTLHWTAFNIPGTATGLAEGLGSGDLPDGTRNGPGIASRGGNPPAYFGPGPVQGHSITMYSSFMPWTRNWICQPIPRVRNYLKRWTGMLSENRLGLAGSIRRRSRSRFSVFVRSLTSWRQSGC